MDANQLTSALLDNQKSERRWKNIRFFTLIFLFLIVIFATVGTASAFRNRMEAIIHDDYVSVVRLSGLIMPGKQFSAFHVTKILGRAFADVKAKGVIIDINSGGGTPVQSMMIHDRIIALKKQFHKKVIIVGEDMLTSGAYLVACAGDKIYVNNDTITGSIGVIMTSFGFNEAIKKLGIERRIITAGHFKGRLDMFEPLSEEEKAKAQSVLDSVHQDFIAIVKQDRGNRLHGTDSFLFSGDFWTGKNAMPLGLVDSIGDIYTVMNKEFGVNHYRDFSPSENMLSNLFGKIKMNMNLDLKQVETLRAQFT